jgi:hypothetical protein
MESADRSTSLCCASGAGCTHNSPLCIMSPIPQVRSHPLCIPRHILRVKFRLQPEEDLATSSRTNHTAKLGDRMVTELSGRGGKSGDRTNKPEDGEDWNQTWGYPEVPPLPDYETAALPLSYAGASDSIAEGASALQRDEHALSGKAPECSRWSMAHRIPYARGAGPQQYGGPAQDNVLVPVVNLTKVLVQYC